MMARGGVSKLCSRGVKTILTDPGGVKNTGSLFMEERRVG